MYMVHIKFWDGSRRVIPFESEDEMRREADEARANLQTGLVVSVSTRGPVPLRIPRFPRRVAEPLAA